MSIPESVTREIKAFHRDSCYPECGNESAAAAARRVILALVESLPESAVEKALDAWYPGEDWRKIFAGTAAELNVRREMRAAIVAALNAIVEGE